LRDIYLKSFNVEEREEGRKEGRGTTIGRTNKRCWRGKPEDRERKVKVGKG
jgi:hypothetical protein